MTLTRGDTGRYVFSRKNAVGDIITDRPQAMFFTVKDSYDTGGVIFQKTLSDMDMDGQGAWHFSIEPVDTERLTVKTYVWDIEVTTDRYVKTIAKGKLTLKSEATWYSNK